MEENKLLFLNRLDDASLDLTAEENVLAQYIKEHYKKVSFLELSDVSKILFLESPLIDAYCRKMGYRDYEDFRKSLRDMSMSELSSTDRFEFSQLNMNSRIVSVKNAVIGKELDNLNKMMEDFDESVFFALLEEVRKAPEIIVVATRSSAIIADYATQMFCKVGKRTTAITSGASEHFDQFALFDTQALVLAFGFARYPKETVRVLSFFRKHNYKIISITDNSLSPLAPLSDLIVPIPCESVSITDFYATPMSFVNILVILFSQVDKEQSASNLTKFEYIAKEYGFYF